MTNNNKIFWDDFGKTDLLPVGKELGDISLLFDKIEDEQVNFQIEKLNKIKNKNDMENNNIIPQKESITYDEFTKQDIRIATILDAEKVAKADKLLKLIVDTGIDKRTIVSGIAKYYKPEEIIGKQVCVLINLQPRTLKGIESNGMVLMAEDVDGCLKFISPQGLVSCGAVVS